jgi:hypothetical protein
MNYLPAEPKVHDHKGRKADERQRRRIARAIGLGAIATVALSVGFGTWTHSSRSAAAVGVLETRKNAVPNVLTMTVKEDKGPRTIELLIWQLSTMRRCLPAPRGTSASAMSISAARYTKVMCLR